MCMDVSKATYLLRDSAMRASFVHLPASNFFIEKLTGPPADVNRSPLLNSTSPSSCSATASTTSVHRAGGCFQFHCMANCAASDPWHRCVITSQPDEL